MQTEGRVPSSGPTHPAALQQLPSERLPLASDKLAQAEQVVEFGTRLQALDYWLRLFAAGFALSFAAMLLVTGLLVVLKLNGIWPFNDAPASATPAPADAWHTVVASLVALFSIPTVLLIAVLRSTGNFTKDAGADSLHAALGEKLMGALEKWLGGGK